MARPRTAPSASTMRTAIFVPPMSMPTQDRAARRRRCRRRRRSSMHRQAELAGQQQRAGAEERQRPRRCRRRRSGSRGRAGRGCVGGPRRGSPRTTARRGAVDGAEDDDRGGRRGRRSGWRWRRPSGAAGGARRRRARVRRRRRRGGESATCLGEGDRPPRRREDRRDAGDGLEAAEPAAVAGRAVGLDHDVADLAGPIAVAAEQLVARTRPAPMPRPTLIATRLSGRSSPPNRYVAKAAARLSLATTVGRP